MCTIEGPFYGGKVKEKLAESPLVVTDAMLENMKGTSLVLDETSEVVGEVTKTRFDEVDGWWHLRAVLPGNAPTMTTGLAINVCAKKLPHGGLKDTRIQRVCLVVDPLDEYARFTVQSLMELSNNYSKLDLL
jgi:hypothetical protein